MKIKISQIVTLFFAFVLFSTNVSAQQIKKDFFLGKWNVMVYGTTRGDQRMIIELKRVAGKLQGAIVGPTDDIKKFTEIKENTNSVTLTFKYLLFNVHLYLQKEDDNSVTGKLQNDYKAVGNRMK